MKKSIVLFFLFVLLGWGNLAAYSYWRAENEFPDEGRPYRIVAVTSNIEEGKRLRPVGSLLAPGEVDVAIYHYTLLVREDVSLTLSIKESTLHTAKGAFADEHDLLQYEIATRPLKGCTDDWFGPV